MFRSILSEPLLHFLALGVAIFSLYALTTRSAPNADDRSIEVDKGNLAQLFETFSRTWQRPPTEAEFKELVDGYVKEEIFYREGKKIGLDREDTVFRRRMQQKMEFLFEPSAEELTPRPGELEAYLKAHEKKYRFPAQLAFRQILFKSNAPGDEGEMAATRALAGLRSDPGTDTSVLGDPTLLPARMDLTSTDLIVTVFDQDVARQLVSAPIGQWFGPVRSAYGVHLLFVEEKVASRAPSLGEAKAEVLADWESVRRKEIADKRYAEMRKQYEIKIAWPLEMPASPIKTSGVP